MKNDTRYTILIEQVDNGFTLTVRSEPSYTTRITIHHNIENVMDVLHALLVRIEATFLELPKPTEEDSL